MVRADKRIRVGVSSCLLGERVRYDGGHKRDASIVDVLGRDFEYVPLCPEVAVGMGTPRPPIRLTGDPSRPRVVGVELGRLDVTEKLTDYAHSVAAAHGRIGGYIFKSSSPSCGIQGIPVHDGKGAPMGTSPGLYAGVIMSVLPLMPVEEEGRLGNPGLREDFVERVRVYDRWQDLSEAEISPAGLAGFHRRHEPLALSLSEAHRDRLSRLVAESDTRGIEAVSRAYIEALMEGLARRQLNIQ